MFSLSLVSTSEQETEDLSIKLANMAKMGDVFLLEGTLGAGKSTFARAFIKKLSKAEEVPSPTFTLVQSYTSPKGEIFHFDLYRIKSPEEVFELGIEEAMSEGICLIEWAEKMGGFRPRDAFIISISHDAPSENSRKIIISTASPDKFARLESLK